MHPIVTSFTTGFLGGLNPSVIDELCAPDIRVITGLKPQGPILGIGEYKSIFFPFEKAFPLTRPLEIIDQFTSADGTRVVTRFHAHTIHAGEYYGLPATNRPILLDETHVARLSDGRIIENIVSATNLEFEMLLAPVLKPYILP